MRSVFLFPSSDLTETVELLQRLGTPNGPGEWIVDSCLYVAIVDPPYWDDWAPNELLEVEECFGKRPETMVQVDVSGRVPGRKEVFGLCAAVLEQGGVASDDYSNCWQLDEILNSVRDGRRFFESFK